MLRVVVGFVVGMSLLLGCSDDKTQVLPTGPIVTAPSSLEAETQSLVDFAQEKQDFLALVDVLAWNQSVECMAEKGFQLMPRQIPESSPQLAYGLPEDSDPAHGFHIPSPDVLPQDSPHVEEPAYIAALMGDPSTGLSRSFTLASGETVDVSTGGGCMGQARSALFGSPEAYVQSIGLLLALQDIELTAHAEFESSTPYLTLLSKWAACMLQHGLAFDSPLAVWSFAWPAAVSQQEVEAATADILCKKGLDFEKTANELLADTERVLVDRSPGIIENWNAVKNLLFEKLRTSAES